MGIRAWLLKWAERVGVALGATVGVIVFAGPLVLGLMWAAGEDMDRLRDWWEQPEARVMEKALRQAFEAKDRERMDRAFALAGIVEPPLRHACVIRYMWPPANRNDPAIALAERAGRIWFWRFEKADASLALELADGTAHLLRVWPPIELRFEQNRQRSVCAPADRLTFLPLTSDNRAVVFLVRGD